MPVFPNNVSLRQLRAFDEVARQGAFAPAARELCLTQSALSESIRQLEDALGMRLFDRTTRTVGLTSAGQAFLVDVRHAFDTLEQGFQNLGDLAALRRGKVRIAAAPSVLAVLLLPVLPALRAQYPGIEVDLIEDSAEGIAQRVQAGLVDFGVGAAHPAGGDLLTQPLAGADGGGTVRAALHRLRGPCAPAPEGSQGRHGCCHSSIRRNALIARQRLHLSGQRFKQQLRSG